MPDNDIMKALRISYKEVLARRDRFDFGRGFHTVSSLRRYILYFADLLDIYLSIQRDRRWRQRNEDWDD